LGYKSDFERQFKCHKNALLTFARGVFRQVYGDLLLLETSPSLANGNTPFLSLMLE